MHEVRLALLAAYLQTQVDEDEFDLSSWHYNTGCGYTACAVGHAAHIPEFKSLGFLILESEGWATATPEFMGLVGWEAVQKLFGIDRDQAAYLFQRGYYAPGKRKAKDVAERITYFLSVKGDLVKIERDRATLFGGKTYA